MDYSTINLTRLTKRTTWNGPDRLLQKGSGNGCAGDAPGYPTYFTRHVYSAAGNCTGAVVITYDGVHYLVNQGRNYEGLDKVLHSLWVPPAIDSERTQLWLDATYQHHQRCYNGFGDDMVIYPVPYYRLGTFHDDPRFSDQWRAESKARIEAANADVIAKTEELATPETHNAVRVVRRFYPDHMPDLARIANPSKALVMWWETEAVQPSEQVGVEWLKRLDPKYTHQ